MEEKRNLLIHVSDVDQEQFVQHLNEVTEKVIDTFEKYCEERKIEPLLLGPIVFTNLGKYFRDTFVKATAIQHFQKTYDA